MTNPGLRGIFAQKMRFYTTGEASRVLGVSGETLRHWVRSGKLNAAVTRGGHLRIPEIEITRLLGERFGAPIERIRMRCGTCGKLFMVRGDLPYIDLACPTDCAGELKEE